MSIDMGIEVLIILFQLLALSLAVTSSKESVCVPLPAYLGLFRVDRNDHEGGQFTEIIHILFLSRFMSLLKLKYHLSSVAAFSLAGGASGQATSTDLAGRAHSPQSTASRRHDAAGHAAHSGPVHNSCGQHLGVFHACWPLLTLTLKKQIIAHCSALTTMTVKRASALWRQVSAKVATAFEDDLAGSVHPSIALAKPVAACSIAKCAERNELSRRPTRYHAGPCASPDPPPAARHHVFSLRRNCRPNWTTVSCAIPQPHRLLRASSPCLAAAISAKKLS
jgi:hypothetical protein